MNSPSRLAADLETAGRFSSEGPGVTRFAWSPELAAANEWLAQRMRDVGLAVGQDAAGNVIGCWDAGSSPALVVGSHLDTVPCGGRYDGALGVLAGLEAIRLLRERGIEPRRPIWLVSFMDEEGARFGASLFGSRAFVGEPMQRYSDCRDAAGVTLRDVLVDTGRSFEGIGAARAIDDVGAYLELHIEQGPTLEEAGLDIGVVTGIAGSQRFFARFVGKANHAGTTPMAGRRDALAGAARAALALREEARSRDDLTATVGTIRVEPGSVNVIPGICEFSIDMRSPADEGFASIEPFVRSTLEQVAASEGLELELEQRARNEPEQLPRGLQDVLEAGSRARGRALEAHAQRRRARRDGTRTPRPDRDGVRAQPRWNQPLAERVHRARPLRPGRTRPCARARAPGRPS